MGISLQRQGNLDAASSLYQKILDEQPENAEALHYLGLVSFQQGDFGRADDLMSRSLQINPTCANTLSDLGMVKVEREQYREALPLFNRALQLNDRHTDALNNMATALSKLSHFEEAIPAYERLATLRPQSAHVFRSLADAQYRANMVTDSIENYRKAIELQPDDKAARVGLGEALESAGKFKQAKLQYLAVLRRDPNSPLALSKLLQLRDGDVDSKWIDKAREIFGSEKCTPDGMIRLHVALGYYYDRIKSYDEAFRHFKLGYDAQSTKEPYDSQRFSTAIDRLIKLMTKEFFQSAASSQNTSGRPIFIVGMPRSGTTLTEQILASHSQVAAGGELPTLLQVSYQAQQLSYSRKPYPYSLTDIGRVGLSKLARKYLKRLDKVSPTARMVTDKLPFNFIHLGVISMLFPNAKIIHCSRNPLDNCLSCYFTSFADQIKFANNLDALGRYYLDYRRLMTHWRQVLPIRIFDLQYEELIGNTEEKVRELLAYCELDWEDACLSFYENKRGIRTPSRWQVRQPIYSDSVQRWRHYEKQLTPLLQILAPVLADDQ
jgi:tetratricopeptide (TPR) repeat protein